MAFFAFCANKDCSEVLKLDGNLASGFATHLPKVCPSCGSSFISRCWYCLNSIVRPPQPNQPYRCEFCRADLRWRSTACTGPQGVVVDRTESETSSAKVGDA